MKWVSSVSVLFVAFTLLASCHSKQKIAPMPENVIKVDTVHQMHPVQNDEEKTIYDSLSGNHFTFKNLSRQFNIELDIKRFTAKNDIHDSCLVKATLLDKKTHGVIDSLHITSLFFYTNYFDIPSHIVSYSTGAHVFKEVVDNYAGDLAIVDLNFDGRDDVALINDMGGIGGPLYCYFVQQPNRKFILDRYLTDSMSYFPATINNKKKTLTTYVHAGACCVGRQIYQYNSEKHEWTLLEHVILGLPAKKK